MPTVALQGNSSVTLDGSGNGQVSFGPMHPGASWRIERMSVSVTSNDNEPTVAVYRNSIGPGQLISSSYVGSFNTDSQVSDSELFPGEIYICRWEGGDPDAVATISYSGTAITKR